MSLHVIDSQGGNIRNFHILVSGTFPTIEINLPSQHGVMSAYDITIVFETEENIVATITWPSNVWWELNLDGVAPNGFYEWDSEYEGKLAVINLTTFDDGYTWYGNWTYYMLPDR